MFKLYVMNIYLCGLLLHFVANQEKLFLKIDNSEQKIEFTLDLNNGCGNGFYRGINVGNDEIDMKRNGNFFASTEEALYGTCSNLATLKKGELGVNGFTFYIGINEGTLQASVIGKIKNLTEFESIISGTNVNNEYTFYFRIVKEKDETQKENETPKKMKHQKKRRKKWGDDWKTVKIIKIFKALKRYRIVKRMRKMKTLKN